MCVEESSYSSASVHVVSATRVHIHPMPLLVERRALRSDGSELVPHEHWGQLRVSLKAEDWRFGAPQKPVWVEVRDITLISPQPGLTKGDGAKYLRVEPARLLFSVENATDVQTFYIQVNSQRQPHFPYTNPCAISRTVLPQRRGHVGVFPLQDSSEWRVICMWRRLPSQCARPLPCIG